MSTAETLRALLDGPHTETRERVRWWLSQPGNEPVDDLPLEEHRARVLACHTAAKRAEELEAYVQEVLARQPAVSFTLGETVP